MVVCQNYSIVIWGFVLLGCLLSRGRGWMMIMLVILLSSVLSFNPARSSNFCGCWSTWFRTCTIDVEMNQREVQDVFVMKYSDVSYCEISVSTHFEILSSMGGTDFFSCFISRSSVR